MTKLLRLKSLLIGATLTLTVLSTQAAPQQKDSQQKDKSGPAPVLLSKSESHTPTPAAATDDPSYVIGAEDELNVSVWKEPDLTRTVPVRPDGKISLPLINDIQAVGLTPMKLASSISEKLRKYINDPQVTVIVTAINSRRIYVLGEVIRAGAYPMFPDMTVLQAISSAGGFSQFANQKSIYILRMENGHQIRLPFNYKEVVRGEKPEQNIPLKPGDTIVVP